MDPYMLSSFDAFRCRFTGSREAVYDHDQNLHYTFDDLSARAGRLAAFLTVRLGLEKGDRIAFCALNGMPFIDAFFASMRTGIILTTYNGQLGPREILRMMRKEDPKVVFYSPVFSGVLAPVRLEDPGRVYIPLDGPPAADDLCGYEQVMANEPAEEIRKPLDMEDIQMLIHTGGTTGHPKAAMVSYRAVFYNALAGMLSLGLTENDSALLFLPLFHTAAWNVAMLSVLFVGGRIILTGAFDPGVCLSIIHTERPTLAMAVETIYRALAAHPNFEKTDFSGYRWMISGAAPITRGVLETYWARDIKLFNCYGMTEIGPSNLAPHANDMSIDQLRAKWNSCGKPLFFNHVRVVDEAGNDLPTGRQGELIWRGDLLFSGYWMEPEQTAMVWKDGWVYSGDIGYVDQDGYYYISGRKKNMYISGGENIFPVEIEEVLLGHPHVAGACVIGVADEKWGEAGKALVVAKPGAEATREALREYLKGELPKLKVPKYLQFVEEVPRNAVGKLDLETIRAMYGQPGEE